MRNRPTIYIDPLLGSNAKGTDPISSVLALLEPRAEFSALLELGGPWSFSFPPEEGVRFCTVVQGQCWFTMDEDGADSVHLQKGDCFLLFSTKAFLLSNDPSCSPVDVRSLLGETRAAGAVHLHDTDKPAETIFLGGRFEFNRDQALVWFGSTEPFVHIPACSKQAAVIGWIAQQLREELSSPAAAGSILMLEQLAQLLLVQALRAYCALGKQMRQGWLGALADTRIGAALTQIHRSPRHRWSLKELASAVGMSQSSFSALFKRRVGLAPLEYVLQWRMQLAVQALLAGKQSIAEIAFP